MKWRNLKVDSKHIEHLTDLMAEFNKLFPRKYIKGQLEHRTNLWETDPDVLLDMAIEENLDQFAYLMTLKLKANDDRS